MAAGPGIVPLGRIPKLEIVDVAPILLRSLGVPQEVPMEGRCPEALFDASAPVHEPGAPLSANGTLERNELEEDDEVQADVLKRLRAIGYLAQ